MKLNAQDWSDRSNTVGTTGKKRATVDISENTTATSLRWSVKDSLLQYVRALGEISYAYGLAEQGDELHWPLVADRHDPDGARIAQYRGEIHLRAHDGLLDIVIADPEVRINDKQGQLSVRTTLDGSDHIVIATLDVVESPASTVCAEVRVTPAGSMMFGANYPSGAKLSPLTVGVGPQRPSP
ncbi:HtaA domain-containing protein [Rhodococcus sp. 5A-K4]|uniref:HtaA domain-containing protein n=1 Tax=Rhodococcus sp. 5A-K4 TaxID=3384442 RepID=UPI0038D41234